MGANECNFDIGEGKKGPRGNRLLKDFRCIGQPQDMTLRSWDVGLLNETSKLAKERRCQGKLLLRDCTDVLAATGRRATLYEAEEDLMEENLTEEKQDR